MNENSLEYKKAIEFLKLDLYQTKLMELAMRHEGLDYTLPQEIIKKTKKRKIKNLYKIIQYQRREFHKKFYSFEKIKLKEFPKIKSLDKYLTTQELEEFIIKFDIN